MFVGQFLPEHQKLCDQYVETTYAFFISIKQWIEIRIQRGDEKEIIEKIKNINVKRNHLEYPEGEQAELLIFNGAYLALMRRYCWLLEDLKTWFNDTGVTPQDLIKNSSSFRSQIFAIAEKSK